MLFIWWGFELVQEICERESVSLAGNAGTERMRVKSGWSSPMAEDNQQKRRDGGPESLP
jgi:hypothetical protein